MPRKTKKKNRRYGYWKDREVRVGAIRQMVEKIGKPPTDISNDDFRKYKLLVMIVYYYNGSAFKALRDAGYEMEPLDRKHIPQGYWKSPAHRINAIRRMVEKSGKNPCDIRVNDFKTYKLYGLLYYYSLSRVKALKEAGYDPGPPLGRCVPSNYWKKPSTRIKAIRKMVKEISKSVTQITLRDFSTHHLSGVLNYYEGSPFRAIRAAGYDIDAWEMTRVPVGYWDDKNNRVYAVNKMLKKFGKNPNEIMINDFKNFGLLPLLKGHYNCSPFLAMKEMGYVSNPKDMAIKPRCLFRGYVLGPEDITRKQLSLYNPPVEKAKGDYTDSDIERLFWKGTGHIKNKTKQHAPHATRKWGNCAPRGYWMDRDLRIKTIRKFVEKSGKDPCDLILQDFRNARLSGMVTGRYNGSPLAALKDAGYDINPLQRKKPPQGFWDDTAIKVKIIRDMVEKTGKSPEKITKVDFRNAHLLKLLHKFRGSTYVALCYAGYNIVPEKMTCISRTQMAIRENRVDAVKRLVKNVKKPITDIIRTDFVEHGLIYVLARYYKTRPFLALHDAGYIVMPWEMKSGVPRGFWNERTNRVYAITWLIRKTGKTPATLNKYDMYKFGLWGLSFFYQNKIDPQNRMRFPPRVFHNLRTEWIINDINYGKHNQFIPTEAGYIAWLKQLDYNKLCRQNKGN